MPEWLDPSVIDNLRLSLFSRLVLATILGGVVGLERELSGKPAGLRTNILICVGSTLLMEVSQAVAASGIGGPADPGRIAAQVVSGIGFIGAGTILLARGNVVGLTTAATLWVVAAIGLAVGSHAYVEAVGTTALVAVTLVMLGWIEDFLFKRRKTVMLSVVTDPDAEQLNHVRAVLEELGLKMRALEIEKGDDHYRASYEVSGPPSGRQVAFQKIATTPGVRKVTTL